MGGDGVVGSAQLAGLGGSGRPLNSGFESRSAQMMSVKEGNSGRCGDEVSGCSLA